MISQRRQQYRRYRHKNQVTTFLFSEVFLPKIGQILYSLNICLGTRLLEREAHY